MTFTSDKNMLNGIITHSISGFYYVEAADAVYECKARGSFRKEKITPLVGDRVLIETDGSKGTVSVVNERKNYLLRPPVANIDTLFIVSSVEAPKPNFFVIDKLTAFAVYHNIVPVIVFSKCDMANADKYAEIYTKAGFKVICCSANNGYGIDEIKSEISGRVCAFTGNSGVGKSSIINAVLPGINIDTAQISEKLGRGRHTTRSVRLYKFFDGYIADTPGFSSFESDNNAEFIAKDELSDCFIEFAAFCPDCRFGVSCSHTGDKGCAVENAVNEGKIPLQRYKSYCRMYEEVKNIKKWK